MTLKNKKHDCPIKAIRNARFILIFKHLTMNKISRKLKVNCFKDPHYAYSIRYVQSIQTILTNFSD